MQELSELRKKVYQLSKKRDLLLQKVLRTKPFIAAQVYQRYKTCGNSNCKCQHGELHGPFLWIYQNKKGKPILSTTVESTKHREAKDLASNYKLLFEERQSLREIDREINDLLNAIEALLEKEAKDYVTKRNPGRPKKN